MRFQTLTAIAVAGLALLLAGPSACLDTGSGGVNGVFEGDVPPAPMTPQVIHAHDATEDVDLPSLLATDATHVYWLTARGAVQRVFKGATRPTRVASDPRRPLGLALDGRYVYWSVADDDGDGALLRVPKTGGTVETLAQGAIADVAIDDTHLFWVERGTDPEALHVIRATKDGRQTKTLATLEHLTVDDYAFATGPSFIYMLRNYHDGEQRRDALVRVPKTGGDLEAISVRSKNGVAPRAFASDDVQVTWIDRRRRLWTVPADGGDAVELETQGGFQSFVMDGNEVLATRLYGNAILHCTLAGNAPTVVFETSTQPASIVVDGDSVYWTEWSTECTDERYEGKSAWCAAYHYEAQLMRAAR